jgi:hypothetical protein
VLLRRTLYAEWAAAKALRAWTASAISRFRSRHRHTASSRSILDCPHPIAFSLAWSWSGEEEAAVATYVCARGGGALCFALLCSALVSLARGVCVKGIPILFGGARADAFVLWNKAGGLHRKGGTADLRSSSPPPTGSDHCGGPRRCTTRWINRQHIFP